MAIAQEHILGRELPVEGAVRVAMAHGTDQLLEPGIEGGMLAGRGPRREAKGPEFAPELADAPAGRSEASREGSSPLDD